MVVSKFVILALVVTVSTAAHGLGNNFDDECRSEEIMEELFARGVFGQWLRQHEKQYSSEKESEDRFLTFWDHAKQIHNHNNNRESSFTMGLNHLSDLTSEEASRKVGGHIPVTNRVSKRANVQHPPSQDTDDTHTPGEDLTSYCGFSAADVEVPKSVDWRDVPGVLPPVKYQGACGSCWAFTTVSAVESVTAIVTGTPVQPLSEQELTDCTILQTDFCVGGNIEEGYKWVVANGVGSIEDYPYNNELRTNETCHVSHAFKRAATIDNYEVLPRGEDALRKAITISPISVAIDAFLQDFRHYKTGIFDGVCRREIADLGHAVTAVGFGEEDGVPFFVIRNSWGQWWGEGGYIRLKANVYPSSGYCGIAQYAVRPVKDGSTEFRTTGQWPEWAKNSNDLAVKQKMLVE